MVVVVSQDQIHVRSMETLTREKQRAAEAVGRLQDAIKKIDGQVTVCMQSSDSRFQVVLCCRPMCCERSSPTGDVHTRRRYNNGTCVRELLRIICLIMLWYCSRQIEQLRHDQKSATDDLNRIKVIPSYLPVYAYKFMVLSHVG